MIANPPACQSPNLHEFLPAARRRGLPSRRCVEGGFVRSCSPLSVDVLNSTTQSDLVGVPCRDTRYIQQLTEPRSSYLTLG